MDNHEIADILVEIGDILDIQGENFFKVQAYHRAANAVRGHPIELAKARETGSLTSIPGIGAGIAEKIEELLDSGRLAYFEELTEQIPPSVLMMMQIPGVGPKKAKLFYEDLGIDSVEGLLEAAESHRLQTLKGMGPKAEEKIIRGIQMLERGRERILLFEAHPLASRLLADLKAACPECVRGEPAGSLRRMCETIGDIDILVASDRPAKVMDAFTSLGEVSEVIAKGDTKSSVVVHAGLQVDLRVVSITDYGAALQYFTGSQAHNIKLREPARKKGLKISEYGVFDAKTGGRVGGDSEEDIYRAVGMPMMPAVLREDRGEIEAALEGRLPALVRASDIQGDLHVHSSFSDGINKIPELVEAARALGYRYLGLCDHAHKLKIAHGLSEERLAERLEVIKKVNGAQTDVTVLSGIELNIGNKGELDYSDEVLAGFDVVIASVHWAFDQPSERLTERIVAAANNPYVHIIGHPTGRIIGRRDPYPLDIGRVFEACAETGTHLELNSYPDRLDLRDEHLRLAKERYGLKFAINTDAHVSGHLEYIEYGVATAQRGWVGPDDVINTYPLDELRRALKPRVV